MRRSFHARLAAALSILIAVVLVDVGRVVAQGKQTEPKLDEAQRVEAQALIALVDQAMAGQTAVPGLPLTWEHEDFIKAQADKTYVPFTIAIAPGALTTSGIALYVRVVKKGAEAAPAPASTSGEKDDKSKNKDKKAAERPQYPFENLYMFDVPPAPEGQPQRVSRAFAVEPGEYEVYVAVREHGAAATAAPAGGASAGSTASSSAATPPAAGASAATPPAAAGTLKAGVVTHTITVPSFNTGELTTSSIILAEKVDVLQTPLPGDRQADNPYTFGQMKITPAANTTFSKKGELNVVFWIYGAGSDPATKKPDVNIEFKFYQKSGDKETYFNKTDPQVLNAQTLPPQFDLAAGHQLPGSLAVPLTSFPEGDYRLEIEVTDKTANKSVKRDVAFTVTG